MSSNKPKAVDVFLGSEIESSAIEKAAFSVMPVPYEKTTSYGSGTAAAPAAIIAASSQLETWDGQSNPSSQGIHTHTPIDCSGNAEEVLDNIAAAVKNIIDAGSMPVVLGGEHTVTYGAIKGYIDAGITDFGVVQIDAHADLRDQYEGDRFSHACVMKRIVDDGIPLYQLGIRSYCEEEKSERESNPNIHYLDARELVIGNIQSIELPEGFPSKVFFTIDIDGIDPSVFPSTGTPVPGGLGWYQTLSLFESVAKQRDIIGFDIMEFSPIDGFHAYDFAAAQLCYLLMGVIQRSKV